jgi:hypothetical protein
MLHAHAQLHPISPYKFFTNIASTEGSPAARLPWGRGRGHEGGGRGAPGKVGNGVAHRGGRASVGWRGETGAAAFRRRREVRRRLAMLRVTLRFYEREEEVRPSPNGGKWGGESTTTALTSERGLRRWHGRILSEGWCSDGGGGRKRNGEGGFACGVLRSEDGGGKGTEARRRRATPF